MRSPRLTARPGSTGVRRIVGFVIGLILLAAALFAVLTQRDAAGELWSHVRAAPWWMGVGLLLAPVANWLLVAASFTILMRRHGQVGHAEMAQLVGSAWLLNYLPMRPGLIGRVAYHKKVNEIRVRHSASVLVVSVGLSAASAGVLLAAAVAAEQTALSVWVAGAIPLVAAILTTAILTVAKRDWAPFAAAFLLRYLDMLVWVGRYAIVFAIIGQPLTVAQTLLVAVVSQLAIMVPLTGNGLGLREWAVGLTAEGLGGALDAALSADLFNRAAEVLVAVPIGLACSAAIARRLRRNDGGESGDEAALGEVESEKQSP